MRCATLLGAEHWKFLQIRVPLLGRGFVAMMGQGMLHVRQQRRFRLTGGPESAADAASAAGVVTASKVSRRVHGAVECTLLGDTPKHPVPHSGLAFFSLAGKGVGGQRRRIHRVCLCVCVCVFRGHVRARSRATAAWNRHFPIPLPAVLISCDLGQARRGAHCCQLCSRARLCVRPCNTADLGPWKMTVPVHLVSNPSLARWNPLRSPWLPPCPPLCP
jgi:hypothetical protein